jgi:hypothetical protein
MGFAVKPPALEIQELVRLYALYRIEPHAPLLVQIPVNFFGFQSCDRSTQAACLCVDLSTGNHVPDTQHASLTVVDYWGL